MLLVAATHALPVVGNSESIAWRDLQPVAQTDQAANPFDALTDDQRDALRQLAINREMEARGVPANSAVREARAALLGKLSGQGIDAGAWLARRDAMMRSRRAGAEDGVASLDGRDVRLGGYLLPTAIDGKEVREFLLVPWVGACSHADPPPPNQIVRVRPAQPHPLADFYEPVQVDGALRVRMEQTPVYLLDGTVNVRSSYAIDDAVVVSTRVESAARP